MPVTAKLSRAFYDRFGDEVANELVGLLNIMDSTHLSELRHLNEQNAARFEARVDQRFAEQDARLERRFAELDAKFADLRGWLEGRFAGVEGRLGGVEGRLGVVEGRFGGIEGRFAAHDAHLERRLGEFQQRQLGWLVGLFIAGVVGVGGLVLRLTGIP
jgi:hypothetical protein